MISCAFIFTRVLKIVRVLGQTFSLGVCIVFVTERGSRYNEVRRIGFCCIHFTRTSVTLAVLKDIGRHTGHFVIIIDRASFSISGLHCSSVASR